MLYFDRTDFSEGTDLNETSESKECGICHYWYFLNYSFNIQPNICNRCHDLLMMPVNLKDIVILNIKGSYLISKKWGYKTEKKWLKKVEHYKA